MPTVETNKLLWTNQSQWLDGGDKWSSEWGSAQSQWYFTIYPRIHNFIPTGTILEIAPGHGRWTQFLKENAHQLIIVDLVENCIETCRKRFLLDRNISYFTNDGKSLDFVKDGSIDFVFSFDSLVHAEASVLETYLSQLSRKLSPNGVGFIHHSNIGEYKKIFSMFNKMKKPQILRNFLKKGGLIEADHWRAHSMTATKFEMFCTDNELKCVSQELVNWQGGIRLIDCFSTFTKLGSKWDRDNRVVKNNQLMVEAKQVSRISPLYDFSHISIKD